MRERAHVVIIGAGMVGCSTAYHLALKGCTDVVVLDQGPLFHTGGSTSHAPGLVFQLNASRTVTRIAAETIEMYSSLSLDGEPGFYRSGSLEVATTPERWEELKRKQGHALSWGVEAHLISPQETKRLTPLIDADQLYGGALYVPGDGIAKSVRLAEAMARAAEARGVAFHGHTRVTGIEVTGERVRAVLTSQGRIAADIVLLCAGIWGPTIGRMAGVPIPLTPVQHLYVKTAPLAELAAFADQEVSEPILRHQDRSMYFRRQGAQYGYGSYRHEPLLVDVEKIPRHEESDEPAVLPFTEEHFAAAREYGSALFPVLADAELVYRINGLFSFTPDGQSLLGESMDVRGFWVAEAVWITHGGGTGKVMAEWLIDGTPGLDLHELDLNRFHAHAAARPYIRARGAQQYREVYDIIHPLQQMEAPRPLRLSPFYARQQELGAAFFESAGWERPQWFAANQDQPQPDNAPRREGWTAHHWSPIIGAEHCGARERVALFDLTPFTKIEVQGPGALAYLQAMASNQMDQPLGRVTYTAMLDDRGGIQCDLTVTRLGEQRFWVLTGGAVGMHDLAWLRRHLPADGSVTLTDVTSAYCTLGLWGPRARDLAQSVCEDNLCNDAFPYFTAQHITIGNVPMLALRVSYVGELGWELYAPTEYGQALWDTLWAAGRPHDLVAAGGGAFESLRLEKGYRLWGAELHTEHNPYEAGLGFAVRLNKGNFRGREALRRIKEQGVARKLCCITLDDPGVVLMGKEPILSGGRALGYVTSAGYGYTVGKSIAYGYLPVEQAAPGTPIELQFFGRRYPATVTREPLYDSTGVRLTC